MKVQQGHVFLGLHMRVQMLSIGDSSWSAEGPSGALLLPNTSVVIAFWAFKYIPEGFNSASGAVASSSVQMVLRIHMSSSSQPITANLWAGKCIWFNLYSYSSS